MVLIEHRITHKVHAVYAAGNYREGSLHDFETLCGIRLNNIEGHENYYEPPTFVPALLTCSSCQRVLDAAKRQGRTDTDIEYAEMESERIARLRAMVSASLSRHNQ